MCCSRTSPARRRRFSPARSPAASRASVSSRIQCTPDLQPTDVTGLTVYDQREREFVFRAGAGVRQRPARRRDQPRHAEDPVGAARGDGRGPGDGRRGHRMTSRRRSCCSRPRTRSSRREPSRCPEAQLDRFFLRTALGYPDLEEELSIVEGQLAGHPLDALKPVIAKADVSALQEAIEGIYVDELLRRWIIELVRATRSLDFVALGASVRGSLALERAARALALIDGRDHAEPGRRRAAVRAGRAAPARADARVPRRRRADGRRDRRRVWEAALAARAAARAAVGRLARGRTARRQLEPAPARLPADPAQAARAARRSASGRARRRGRGSDVAGTRPYVPGDPVSTIDWFASARLSSARGEDAFVVRQLVRGGGSARDRRQRHATRRCALVRHDLPWLSKPAAALAATDAIVRSAIAARAELGHAEVAAGRTRGPLTGRRRAAPRPRPRAARARTTRPRQSFARTLAHLLNRRAELPAGIVRLRALRLPGQVPAGIWSSMRAAYWEVVPGDPPGSRLGAELPAGRRRRDPVRVAGRRARRRSCGCRRATSPPCGARTRSGSHGCSGDSAAPASIPVLLGTSSPFDVDTTFLRWAERRRRRRR